LVLDCSPVVGVFWEVGATGSGEHVRPSCCECDFLFIV
jgi:hypothetical protein